MSPRGTNVVRQVADPLQVHEPERSANDSLLDTEAHSLLPAREALQPKEQGAGKRRVLVLFGHEWQDEILPLYREPGGGKPGYEFFCEGFDPFAAGGSLRVALLNFPRYVDRLERKYRGRIDAIVTTDETYGLLAGAFLAERLGLPFLRPETVVLAQHKLNARYLLRDKLPELAPPWFDVAAYDMSAKFAKRFPYPLYVKPVRGAGGVLVREVQSAAELRRHLRLWPWEKWAIKRLIGPYNQALKAVGGYTFDAHHMVLEAPLHGLQISVDAYVYQGRVRVLGIADEVMYPPSTRGHLQVMRYEFPGHYAERWVAKVRRAAIDVAQAFGIDIGFVNIEFLLDPDDGGLKLLEIHPCMAPQMARFYRWTRGIDAWGSLLAIACGQDLPPSVQPQYGAAATFVLRAFDGEPLPPPPSADDLAWLAAEYPDAHLKLLRTGALARERHRRWLGSVAYARLSLPSKTRATLRSDFEAICARLRWPVRY